MMRSKTTHTHNLRYDFIKFTFNSQRSHDYTASPQRRCIDVEATLYIRHVPAGMIQKSCTRKAMIILTILTEIRLCAVFRKG